MQNNIQDRIKQLSTKQREQLVALIHKELPRSTKRNTSRLTAFYISKESLDPKELRSFASKSLPGYMVPHRFVPVEELPKLPNGKLDIQALQNQNVIQQHTKPTISPVNTLKEKLTSIWEKMLNVSPIHPDDNFFEIGGDSMISIQIVGEAQKLGIDLQPNQLFENQTIAELVHSLSEGLEEASILKEDAQTSSPNSEVTNASLEQELTSIWEKMLNVSPIHPDDNFFEIGGDSMISIQIVGEAQKLGIELQPNQLFENQTIAELVHSLSEELEEVNTLKEGTQTSSPNSEVTNSSLEQKLTSIWEKMLNVNPIHPDDNFFEIGGDSMISIQIVGEAQKLGIELQPNQLFENQTIAELVHSLSEELEEVSTLKEEAQTSSPNSEITNSSLEQKLTSIWEKMLNVNPIHPDDNFFEIGGDSMISIQIVGEAQKLGIELQPNQLFENQTIAELVHSLTEELKEKNQETQSEESEFLKEQNTLIEENQPKGYELPLTFIQKALYFHSQQQEKDHGFIQIFFNVQGNIDHNLIQRAWKITTDQYEALRSSIIFDESNTPKQFIYNQAPIHLEVLDWQHFDDQQQNTKFINLKEENTKLGIELLDSLVNRLYLIQIKKNKYWLFWSCHHIMLDAFGANLIAKNFFKTYDAISKNRQVNLPSSPTYQSYLNWVSSQDTNPIKSFWRQQFQQFTQPSLLTQPSIHSSSDVFQELTFILEPDKLHTLQQFSQKTHITLNACFHGIWNIILSEYLATNDVVYGMTVSGRNIPFKGINLLPNQLMNVLPVRVHTINSLKLSDYLQELQRQLQQIRQFEFITIDQISDWCNLSNNILFDTLINFQHFPERNFKVGDISIYGGESNTTSIYPLTIHVQQRPEKFLVSFHYNKKLVATELIDWVSKQFKFLIEYFPKSEAETIPAIRSKLSPINLNQQPSQNSSPTSIVDRKETFASIPKNLLESQLLKIWRDLFGSQQVQTEDNFFEIGGTSLLAVRLASQINKQLGKKIVATALLKHPTIRQLSNAIGNKNSLDWSSIVQLQPNGHKPPLFVIHGAGGLVFNYLKTANHIAQNQPFYGIQSKGLNGGDIIDNIPDMASSYIEDMKKIQPHGPYLLSGGSTGGIIAFEMAKQLKAQQEDVALLVLLDTVPRFGVKFPSRSKVFALLERVDNMLGKLLQVGSKVFFDSIKKNVRNRLGLKPKKEIDVDKKNRGQLISRTLKAIKNYKLEPYDGKITYFIAADTHYRFNRDIRFEWIKYAKKGMEIHKIPGDHHTMIMDDEHVKIVAQTLDQCIERALDDSK